MWQAESWDLTHCCDLRMSAKERAGFLNHPNAYLLNLLGDKRLGQLKVTKEEVEEYLHDIHSNLS